MACHNFGGHVDGGHAVGSHNIGGQAVGEHEIGGHAVGGHKIGGHAVGGRRVGGHRVELYLLVRMYNIFFHLFIGVKTILYISIISCVTKFFKFPSRQLELYLHPTK